nr:uncharacterized protein LOC111985883 [Quercus suber]POE84783.1 hypothetical protein CFP56_79001 [Quercus suber]
MVNIYCAYTEKINPPGATPVLTKDQVWTGLQKKIRTPQDFLPMIVGTDVVSESETEVVRIAHFKGEDGKPGREMKEVCKSYYPTKVDFHQPNGAVIANIISDGESLTEHDYNLTFTFEWRHPDMIEGGEEHKSLVRTNVEMAKGAVHSSIGAVRNMAARGEL